MRCLGILSVREDNKEKNKGRIRILKKERFCREIPVIVAEFLVSKEKLQKKKPWQKRRLFQKGERFLHRLGADAVAPTLLCSSIFGIPVNRNMTLETALFPQDMPAALNTVLLQYRESPRDKVGWVLDRECSPVCQLLLGAMSQKVQYLSIVTGEREKAEVLENLLWEEYGVSLDILTVFPWKTGKNTVVADVDKGRISVDGKTVLSGKRLSLDLQGYQVDLSRLLKQFPELWDVLSFDGWCMEKAVDKKE